MCWCLASAQVAPGRLAFSPLLTRQSHFGVFHGAKANKRKRADAILLLFLHHLCSFLAWTWPKGAGTPWAAGAAGFVAVPHGRQHRLSQHLRSAHVCRKVSVSISPQPLPGYVFVHVCVFTALQTMKKDGSFQQ